MVGSADRAQACDLATKSCFYTAPGQKGNCICETDVSRDHGFLSMSVDKTVHVPKVSLLLRRQRVLPVYIDRPVGRRW